VTLRERHTGRAQRKAISLAEVLVSMAIMTVLLVSALNTLGASASSHMQINHAVKGEQLAQDLLEEILGWPYADADGGSIGPESGEAGSTRAAFDDVDDFHNWSASPPQLPDGTTLPDLQGWNREVKVQYVKSNDVNTVSFLDDGSKRITVTVRYQAKLVATLAAIRTSASDQSVKVDPGAIQ
jgi:Tfp pilus assembly protein PilV